MKFTLKHLLIFITFVALYIATWTEGTKHHRAKLEREAKASFERYTLRNTEFETATGRSMSGYKPFSDGPHVYVRSCFPIFPGILIAQSGYTCSKYYHAGGLKIVLVYVFGSCEWTVVEAPD